MEFAPSPNGAGRTVLVTAVYAPFRCEGEGGVLLRGVGLGPSSKARTRTKHGPISLTSSLRLSPDCVSTRGPALSSPSAQTNRVSRTRPTEQTNADTFTIKSKTEVWGWDRCYKSERGQPAPRLGQKLEMRGCVLKVSEKFRKCSRCFLLRGVGSPKSYIFFFFFLLKCKFICETMFFPLSCSLLKLPNRNAGQSVEPLRLQRASPCARP